MRLQRTYIAIACAILLAMALIAVALSSVMPGSPGVFTHLMVFHQVVKSQRARERALCRIDHQALRLAGRELLNRAAAGELKTDVYYRIRKQPHSPESSQFPKVILDLAPESIIIDDGRLRAGVYEGGMDHCGILIYPEDFVEPYPGFHYGHRKLLDGLWYYDDEYNFDPEYGKIIDAMIERGVNRK